MFSSLTKQQKNIGKKKMKIFKNQHDNAMESDIMRLKKSIVVASTNIFH
jgi:hypothetical protein